VGKPAGDVTFTLIARSAWQNPAQPVVGPASTLNSVVRIVVHYTAAARIPADVPGYLRAIQNDYTTNRGYSIGYNWAVGQDGRAWELRGFDIRCAANSGVNDTSLAILMLVDGQDPANAAMVNTTRQLVALIRTRAPGAQRIVGHQQVGSTGCPGAGLQAQVAAGVFEPQPEPAPSPPPVEDDIMPKIFRNELTGHVALVFLGDGGTRMYGLPKADIERVRAAYNTGPNLDVSDAFWNDVRVKALISMGYDPDTGKPRS
jgi:hypothetical protein